jgi:hypothetical protein
MPKKSTTDTTSSVKKKKSAVVSAKTAEKKATTSAKKALTGKRKPLKKSSRSDDFMIDKASFLDDQPQSDVPVREEKKAWFRNKKKDDQSLDSLFSNVRRPEFSSKAETESLKSSDGSNKVKNKKKSSGLGRDILGLIIKILILLVVVLALILSFDILGVYRLGFDDNISFEVSKMLNLPAGKVDGVVISVPEYLENIKLLRPTIVNEREGFINYRNDKEINDIVFYSLVANKLIEDRLRAYNSGLAQADLDAQIEGLYQQAGGKIKAEQIIADLYGLSVEQFKEKVLRPMLNRELLQQVIVADDTLESNTQSRLKAEEVLMMAQQGANFSELATKYSDDETTLNIGGELGWVSKGQLDPRWEEAVFNAPENSILPELVKSDFGYHIIRIGEKTFGSDEEVLSIKLSHILVAVDVDLYIKSLLDSADIIRYIK